MTEPILVCKSHDGLTVLTLNRPDRSNALDDALVEQLTAAVTQCYGNDTRMLVVNGAGRNFCSGFDRDASAGCSSPALRSTRVETLLQLLWDAPFATLACVQGKAIGAGADLVAACDFRLGAPGSSYSFPGFKIFGVSLGNRRLAELVGPKKAFELVLQASELDVESAWRCRLVTDVVPQERFCAEIEGILGELAHTSVASIASLRNTLLI